MGFRTCENIRTLKGVVEAASLKPGDKVHTATGLRKVKAVHEFRSSNNAMLGFRGLFANITLNQHVMAIQPDGTPVWRTAEEITSGKLMASVKDCDYSQRSWIEKWLPNPMLFLGRAEECWRPLSIIGDSVVFKPAFVGLCTNNPTLMVEVELHGRGCHMVLHDSGLLVKTYREAS